jgi:hypothetical protein
MPGLLNQRRLINEFYPQGQIILCADDDLKGIKTLRQETTFLDLVNYGVSLLKSKKAGLFGILPNSDGRKMCEQLTSHLTHILGAFFICVNDKDCIPTTNEIEDYQRSILYFKKYGSVLRWKAAGVDTQYGKNPGGLQRPGRAQRKADEVDYIIETYPGMAKVRMKNGTKDLLLNWRAEPPASP